MEQRNFSQLTPTPLGFHRCTDDEYSSFNEPAPVDSRMVAHLRSNLVLFCVDEGQDIYLKGHAGSDSLSLGVDLKYACGANCTEQDRAATKAYLSSPQLVILSNSERFDSGDFTSECIVKESILTLAHIDKSQANIMQASIRQHFLEDEISFIQYGQFTPYDFFTFETSAFEASDINKIVGLKILRQFDTETIHRETYDLLEYLGDVGGLMGLLCSIGMWMVGWFSTFMAKGYFISKLYYQDNSSMSQTNDTDPAKE